MKRLVCIPVIWFLLLIMSCELQPDLPATRTWSATGNWISHFEDKTVHLNIYSGGFVELIWDYEDQQKVDKMLRGFWMYKSDDAIQLNIYTMHPWIDVGYDHSEETLSLIFTNYWEGSDEIILFQRMPDV